MHLIRIALVTGVVLIGVMAQAAPGAGDFDVRLLALQQRWALADFGLQGENDAQGRLLEKLQNEVNTLRMQFPARAEPLVMQGIVLSARAGFRGGMAGLDLIRQARTAFEQSLVLDPAVMDASAHARLGLIYARVPAWPLGFGDEALARTHFAKALELAPQGLEAHLFFGNFLLEQGDARTALQHFNAALKAAPLPCQALADLARRAEIRASIARAQQALRR